MGLDLKILISLVKECPEICTNRIPKDGSKLDKVIKRQWRGIARKMKVPEKECRHEWTGLRNHYAALLRKNRTDPSKKITWYLEQEFKFMKKFMDQERKRIVRSLGDMRAVPHTAMRVDPFDACLDFMMPDRDNLSATELTFSKRSAIGLLRDMFGPTFLSHVDGATGESHYFD